jgi:hypothetical protein
MTASTRGPGRIERLPKFLLCVPLVAQWFWLALRYRSLTLPSVVNAAIENGGLVGESKLACLERIGPEQADWVARTVEVAPGQDVAARRQAAGLEFPLIAKPDIGWCGYGVRLIADQRELTIYAAAFPRQASFLLQDFVPGPREAGLFYMRRRADTQGHLIAIAVRHQPRVIGDGHQTIARLMEADTRLARMIGHYRTSLGAARLAQVPMDGETVLLSTVASLRVGGRYEDAFNLHSPALEARVDAIARSMRGFHFGRFDVRFTSDAALRNGDFRIIEVNGAGSEAIQFWDPSLRLVEAYRGVFAKQAMLFHLAAEFRAAGRRPIGVWALARAWRAQLRLMRSYPASN